MQVRPVHYHYQARQIVAAGRQIVAYTRQIKEYLRQIVSLMIAVL